MTTATTGADHVLPVFDATRVERLSVGAPADLVFAELRRTDLMQIHSALMDAAMWVRALPLRLRRRTPPPPPSITLAGLFDRSPESSAESADETFGPWVPLSEVPGRALVFGIVGRFWTPTITWRRVPPEDFPGFAEPGWGSIVAALTVDPTGDRSCVLTYEARTRCHDEASRRAFRRYWTVVSPFVGHIERALLRDVARRSTESTAAA